QTDRGINGTASPPGAPALEIPASLKLNRFRGISILTRCSSFDRQERADQGVTLDTPRRQLERRIPGTPKRLVGYDLQPDVLLQLPDRYPVNVGRQPPKIVCNNGSGAVRLAAFVLPAERPPRFDPDTRHYFHQGVYQLVVIEHQPCGHRERLTLYSR